MTLYDAIMLAIVVFMALQGAWRGLAWQIAPVASLVIGYMVAGPVSPSIAPFFGKPPYADLLALVAVYAAVSLAVYMMVRSVKDSLDRLKLSEFDKHLGFLLGAVKGVIITLVITVVLVTVSPAARENILRSESHSIGRIIISETRPLLPRNIRRVIDPYLKDFDLPDMMSDGGQVIDPYYGNVPQETRRSSPARPSPEELNARMSLRRQRMNNQRQPPVDPYANGYGNAGGYSNNPQNSNPYSNPYGNQPYNPSPYPQNGAYNQPNPNAYDPRNPATGYPSAGYNAGAYLPPGNPQQRFSTAPPDAASQFANEAWNYVAPWMNQEGGDAPAFDATGVSRNYFQQNVLQPALQQAQQQFDNSIRQSWPDNSATRANSSRGF